MWGGGGSPRAPPARRAGGRQDGMFRVPRERQGGASWPQVRLVPSEPPRVSACPGGAPGGARGSHGELSFPARPRTALEPRAGRSIAGRAAPTAPPADTGRRPLRPLTQELRPSVRPWPCHVQPHGSADPHVPRGVRRGRGSGVETLALSGRPRPPSWFPRCPRLRGHPSLPGHPCPGRGVAAAVPPSPRAPPRRSAVHTHALQPRASRPRQPPLGVGDPSPPRPPHWDGVLAGCRGGGLAGRTPGDCLNGVTRSLPGPSSFCVAYLCLKHIKMT